ncbi:MAG: TPM domain-containing protein, partial [Bacteroidota bacterium]
MNEQRLVIPVVHSLPKALRVFGAACLLTLLIAPASLAQRSVPTLFGRVQDEADLLSRSTERTLTSMLEAHEDSTTNQIAILTIPSLEGDVLEEFSIRVVEAWQLGRADLDNGVLILISRDDRKMR